MAMHLPPLAAFLIWIPLSLWCFRRYPARIAILVHFTAGWAILPAARYSFSPVEFPYWIIGTSLPSDYFLTKSTVLGATALLGMSAALLVFRHHRANRQAILEPLLSFRLGMVDIPILVWCAVPCIASIFNHAGMVVGFTGAIYLTLSWGVPYLLGRIYFSDDYSLELAARALVVAGLAYIPICLVELVTGPQLYHLFYGYQPFRWVGAVRPLGYRPIGLLEIGNQLGIWMSSAALAGLWYWRRNPFEKISIPFRSRLLQLSARWAALSLVLVTLLCQSAGSIILLVALSPLVLFSLKLKSDVAGAQSSVSYRWVPRLIVSVLVGTALVYALLLFSSLGSLRTIAASNPVARSAVSFFRHIGKSSFVWRVAQDDLQVSSVLRKPIFGTAQWNWWQESGHRPWDLAMLILGAYGFIGLVAFLLLQWIPILRNLSFTPTPARDASLNQPPGLSGLRLTLAAVILMSAIDNLLNSSMILSLLLILGGLTTLQSRARQGSPARTLESV